MRLNDLLRQVPGLRVSAGQPERLHLQHVELLDPVAPPQAGVLYLHPDAQMAVATLERWHGQGVTVQAGVVTPAASGPQVRTLPANLAWLEYGEGEALPLDLSARLLRLMLGQPQGLSEQEQLRDEVVEELLGSLPDQASQFLERAASLGLDLSSTTQVAVVGTRSPGTQLSRQGLLEAARRAVVGARSRAQTFRTGTYVSVLFDGRSEAPEELARSVADGLVEAFPTHYVLTAVGEAGSDLSHLSTSYHSARAALEIGLERPQQTRWVTFDQVRHLLLYRLLRQNPELTTLIEGSLRPLLELPGEYRQVLLRTLAAYLEHNRSPQRAAVALGVHPNTLKYRMRRISELLDLQDTTGARSILYYLAAQLNL